MTSIDLGGSSFTDVSLQGADLTAAVFEGAILQDTDLEAGQLCFTQMPNEMRASCKYYAGFGMCAGSAAKGRIVVMSHSRGAYGSERALGT